MPTRNISRRSELVFRCTTAAVSSLYIASSAPLLFTSANTAAAMTSISSSVQPAMVAASPPRIVTFLIMVAHRARTPRTRAPLAEGSEQTRSRPRRGTPVT